jgi:hypothetical protein
MILIVVVVVSYAGLLVLLRRGRRKPAPPSALRDEDWVSASDIGSYVYCAKLYRLSKVDKVPLSGSGRNRLEAGTKGHNRHGRMYDVQVGLRRFAFKAAMAAAAVVVVWGLFLFLGDR